MIIVEKTYVTIQGDMWDTISYKVYRNENYAGVLMQANPELLNTFIFGAETVLVIPELELESPSGLPSWR